MPNELRYRTFVIGYCRGGPHDGLELLLEVTDRALPLTVDLPTRPLNLPPGQILLEPRTPANVEVAQYRTHGKVTKAMRAQLATDDPDFTKVPLVELVRRDVGINRVLLFEVP